MDQYPASDALVVLAAGLGKRLGSVTSERPKWLARVGSETIADRQLRSLAPAFEPAAERIVVVTGFAHDSIARFLSDSGIRATTVHNDRFAAANNWLSLLVGLESLRDKAWDRVFVLNSDLFAAPSIYGDFVESVRKDDTAGGWLAVDLDRSLTEESMKVGTDGDGLLRELGKWGVGQPIGEYIGMAAISRPAVEVLVEVLRSWLDQADQADQWYEGAILVSALEHSVPWRVVPITGAGWVEVDDLADLRLAEGLPGHD